MDPPGQTNKRSTATPSAKCRCGYQLFEGQRCPECGLSFAEATRPEPRAWLWLVAPLVLLFWSCILLPSFARPDAQPYNPQAVAALGVGCVLVWLVLVLHRARHWIPRAIVWLIATCMTTGWIAGMIYLA